MKNRIDVYAALPAVLFLILSFFSCKPTRPEFPFREEAYWKKQGLEDIIPYWTKYAADREHGGFHTTLDRRWNHSEIRCGIPVWLPDIYSDILLRTC